MHTVKGEHPIEIDHNMLGKTCGLLPIGVDSTVLSTTGLQWNLGVYTMLPLNEICLKTQHEVETESSFDGLISTSNHLIPGKNVWIKTTKPIWWTVELKPQIKANGGTVETEN